VILKPIDGAAGYAVSSDGVIFPIKPRYKRNATGLKNTKDGMGYATVTIYLDNGKRKTVLVHQLVAEAFIGPRPDGMVCNHRDGDKFNPRVENLEYVTPGENNIHAFKNGLSHRTNAKLTPDDVWRIRDLCGLGMRNKDIADVYGVSVSTIHLIRHDARWQSLRAERRGKGVGRG
jgi:hypothetical protein